jgi:uncharacterized membrane protein (DUF4010 family)
LQNDKLKPGSVTKIVSRFTSQWQNVRLKTAVLSEFHPYAIALIIGLVIGVEREFHHSSEAQILGVRTFPLIALSGTLAAGVDNSILAAIIAMANFIMIGFGYWRSSRPTRKKPDLGITTEIAAFVVFCSGYIAFKNAQMAIAIGLATLALLASRGWLHEIVRHKLQKADVQTMTVLLVAIFGIGPFLPDQPIDAWGILNPRRLLILFAIVGLVQFMGYAASRIWGSRVGYAVSGFMGGLVSSTAVFLSLKETIARDPEAWRGILAGAMTAVAATLIELLFIVSITSPGLLISLWFPVMAMVATASVMGLLLTRGASPSVGSSPDTQQPPHFWSVIKLGGLLAILVAAVNLAHRYLADAGLWVLAFASGLFELHGVTLAIAIDQSKSTIENDVAAIAVLAAIAASFVSKIAILFLRLPGKHAGYVAGLLSAVLLLGATRRPRKVRVHCSLCGRPVGLSFSATLREICCARDWANDEEIRASMEGPIPGAYGAT